MGWQTQLAWQAKNTLATDSTTAALVADGDLSGVYMRGETPDSPNYPYIVLDCPLSSREDYVIGVTGPSAVAARFPSLQVSWFTETYSDYLAVGEAVEAALDGAELTLTGVSKVRLDGLLGPAHEFHDIQGAPYHMGFKRYKTVI